MKISLLALKKSLGLLKGVIDFNSQEPVFRHIYVCVNNGLEVRAYNEDIVGKISLPTKTDDTGGCFVLAKHFISLINSLNGDFVSISFKDSYLGVKCDRSNYKLQIMNRDEAGNKIEALNEVLFKEFTGEKDILSVGEFSSCFSKISHCLSTDFEHAELQNVFFWTNKMIGCDGYRGALIPFKTSVLNNFSISKKVCDCISAAAPDSQFIVCVDNDYLGVECENLIIKTFVYNNYPYSSVSNIVDDFDYKLGYKIKVKIEPEELKKKLSRIMLFTSEENLVIVQLKQGEIILSLNNENSAEETLGIAECSSKEFSVGLDGRVFKDAIQPLLSQTYWLTNGGDDIQYLYDNRLLQFFLGVE